MVGFIFHLTGFQESRSSEKKKDIAGTLFPPQLYYVTAAVC